MAKRISDETIEQIQILYKELGVKSQVAKKLGISASTVSKYLKEEKPILVEDKKFEGQIGEFDVKNLDCLFTLKEEEIKELEVIRRSVC